MTGMLRAVRGGGVRQKELYFEFRRIADRQEARFDRVDDAAFDRQEEADRLVDLEGHPVIGSRETPIHREL
jgi:hypothetical protein